MIRFNQGKTGAEIIVVVHPALEDHLLKLPTPESDDDFIFPSLAQRKISPLSKQFRKIIQRAHIKQSVIRERSKSSKAGRNVCETSRFGQMSVFGVSRALRRFSRAPQ
jgi:hypothetical protein